MTVKHLLTAAAIGLAASLAVPHDADANQKKQKRAYSAQRDCRPYNGPYGYYGNPWCDGGWKYSEDYPPSSRRYYNLLQSGRYYSWWW